MKELIEIITNAFQETEFPGNENLVSKSYDKEPQTIREHFENQKDYFGYGERSIN